jgi:hypothetical protein
VVTRLTMVVSVIVLVASCSAAPPAVSGATSTTLPATTSSAPTVSTTTTSTSIPTTTATTVPPPGPVMALPTASNSLVAGADGIAAVAAGGSTTHLSDAPTAVAFEVGDSLVVSQGFTGSGSTPLIGEGAIYFTAATGTDSVIPRDGERLRLFDVGSFGGRTVAVATATRGYGPDDTEERLVLFDAETRRRTDLGPVGGWEYGVQQAQLAGDTVVLLLGSGAGLRFEARRAEREVPWRFDLGIVDERVTLVAAPDQIMLLTPRFGDDFAPRLDVTSYDPGTGTLDATYSVALQASFDGGFCQSADWDGVRLLCSESYGGPFAVDLTTGEVSRLSDDLDRGRPTDTVVEPAEEGPSQSAVDAARDGIVPEVAALPDRLRLGRYPEYFGPTRIETPEGVWMISLTDKEIPEAEGCLLGDSSGVYGRDYGCSYDYAEIVLLDRETGAITRAYPFPGMAPRALLVTDDAVYCIRQGDGAYPDSMLCRIDRATLEPYVRVFPSVIDSAFGGDRYVPDYWVADDPVDYVLWSNLTVVDGTPTIAGWSGTATVDPATLELESIVWED